MAGDEIPSTRRVFMNRFAIALFMTVVSCLGQTYTANLTGVVSDPSGGAVPGVAVKLENVATSEKRETVTGGEGRFTFSQLLPGAYELQAEATGFKAVVQRNIILTAGQFAAVNVSLQLGELSQRVEVAAAAVQVDTQTANQSVVLSRDMVLNLPTNLRNPFTLVHLTAPRDSLE
jgi:hypothetical protein